MVFLFFEDIQRTPSPGFAPCQSPSGGVPTATQKPGERPERRRGTPTHTSKKNAVKRPQNAPQRTPAKTAPTQHEPKHRHRTRAAIQDYILQQPGRSSRPQGSPNGDPQTAPQRAGTPPGCNGVTPQTEAAHSGAQAAQRATENAPSRSQERCALYLFIFNRSERTTKGNTRIAKIIMLSPPH